MQMLSEHIRCDQCEAAVRDAQTTFAICVVIFANDSLGVDPGSAVDYAAADATVLADLDLGQDD